MDTKYTNLHDLINPVKELGNWNETALEVQIILLSNRLFLAKRNFSNILPNNSSISVWKLSNTITI